MRTMTTIIRIMIGRLFVSDLIFIPMIHCIYDSEISKVPWGGNVVFGSCGSLSEQEEFTGRG